MIGECPASDRVDHAEKTPLSLVPQGKRELAIEMIAAILSPAQIALDHRDRVAKAICRDGARRRAQPSVEHDRAMAMVDDRGFGAGTFPPVRACQHYSAVLGAPRVDPVPPEDLEIFDHSRPRRGPELRWRGKRNEKPAHGLRGACLPDSLRLDTRPRCAIGWRYPNSESGP